MYQKIKDILKTKNTNLVFSADLTDRLKILDLANKLGPDLLGLKLHSDIIKNFDENFRYNLYELSKKHNFLIIDDRKFCDIGNTVKLQAKKITAYADLITVHAVSGPGVVDGLRQQCEENECGILLIAEMSSEGNLIDAKYTESVIEMAELNDDIVVGFIAQKHLKCGFFHFTPGIKLEGTLDNLGQLYNTPQTAIENSNVDVLIVGRGIYEADNPVEEAKKYIYTQRDYLVDELKYKNIVKHGTFTLKSGQISDIYVDFRLLMGHPKLLYRVARELTELIDYGYMFNVVGVPLGALPVATQFSHISGHPMIMVRDKPKDYGRKNIIEGESFGIKNCVVIEDVVTTGGSVLETIQKLEENDFTILKVLVLLDRENGGVEKIRDAGYSCEALFTLSELKAR